MKNSRYFLIFLILFLTANAGWCETARSAVIHSAMIKFAFAMVGVVISSFLIFAGLSIYTKIFVERKNPQAFDEILKTPKTTEEAIKFFIMKNRLK